MNESHSIRQRLTRLQWLLIGASVVAFVACTSMPSTMFEPPPTTKVDTVVLEQVVGGLASPVQLVEDSRGRLIIADQMGILWAVEAGEAVPILDLTDRMVRLNSGYDERGLLGLALHPEHASNGRLFVSYSATSDAGNSANVVSEFTFAADGTVDAASERMILRIVQPQSNHNGGNLAFGPDGYLYIASGDGGGANDTGVGHAAGGNGQALDTLLGKILRIDVDGAEPYAIPPDNPFAADPAAVPEIWAYGLRNPWGLSFDGERLFAADVGQNRIEEINLIERGGNYGWHIREGRTCFDPDAPGRAPETCPTAGLIDPILDYPHEDDTGAVIGVAVIGGAVYRGPVAELDGGYVFGDWSRSFTSGAGVLFLGFESDDGTWTMIEPVIDDTRGAPLDAHVLGFGRDDAGDVYVLTSRNSGPQGTTGAVYRISPIRP